MIKKIIVFLLSLMFLTACGEINTQKAQPSNQPLNDIYPVEPHIIVTPDEKISPVIIKKVEMIENNEVITLENISKNDIDLNQFILVDPQSYNLKKFAENTIIHPGDIYLVVNGDDQNDISIENDFWLSEIILNYPNDEIILTNKAGRIIWSYLKD